MTDTEAHPELPPGNGMGPPSNLKRSTVKGFVWSVFSAGGQTLLQFGSAAILARILTPGQFGQVAGAMLFIGLSSMLGQVGVSAALVQKAKIADSEISAVYYFSIFFSVFLFALAVIAAPWLNLAVGLPSDSQLIRIIAIQLPLLGLTAVPLGMLQRELRFRSLALIDVLSYAAGIVGLSVVLAKLGFGATSLVWGQVLDAALTAAGYNMLWKYSRTWLGFRRLGTDVRELLKFGGTYSVSQIGNWFAGNGDTLVVANTLSNAQLGVYSRAYQLLVAPATLIGTVSDKVLFPAMARVQHDSARLARSYVTACSVVALACTPISVIMFFGADDITALLLGPRWHAVAAPLQIFSLVLLPRTSYKVSGSLTRARGAVVGGAVRQWIYALEVVVFSIVGFHWGARGVAVGSSVAIVLHFVTMLQFSSSVTVGLWGSTIRMYWRHVPSVVLCCAVGYAGNHWCWPSASPFARLVGLTAAVAVVAAASVFVFRRRFESEIEVLSLVTKRGGTPKPGAQDDVAAPGRPAVLTPPPRADHPPASIVDP